MKRWQSLALGLIVSVATLAYALRGVDFNQLRDEFARGRYLYLLPALVFVFAGLFLRTIRWRVLLNNKIRLDHSFHILNASYLLNAILPLRLGEVARAYLTTRLDPPISLFTSLSSTVVERLTDVIAVFVLFIGAIAIAPISPDVEKAAYVSGVIAIAGMVVLSVFAARPALAHRLLDVILRIVPALERFHIRQLADRVLEGIAPLGSVRGAVLIFFWTAVSWLSSIIATYLITFVFFEKPTINAIMLMTAIASLAIALPAVPGSVGPFEAAMVTGLILGGMATDKDPRAFACAVLVHLVVTASYAVLGWIGLSYEKISLGELLRSARQVTVRQKTEEEPATP
jgi:uncharacterized protein (TIRG00374 family)